jgi:transposase
MMYFPPACPDLNPQEHVWKLARDAVVDYQTKFVG